MMTSMKKTNFNFNFNYWDSSMALPYQLKGGCKTSNSNSEKEKQLHDSMAEEELRRLKEVLNEKH